MKIITVIGARPQFIKAALVSLELAKRNVDELIILDIEATVTGKKRDYSLVRDITQECNVPVTFGGGIANLEDAELILRNGADKISCNWIVYHDPSVLNQVAAKFGSQSIIFSLDYKWINGQPMCFSRCGTVDENISVHDILVRLKDYSYGELLLTNIEKDGCFSGLDQEILKYLPVNFDKPILLAGGAKDSQDFEKTFKAFPYLSGICASSVFVFTELTPRDVKSHLHKSGINIRI